MKVGIDCRTILNPGFGEQAGVGHYTYFLTRHLLELDHENEYVLFFDRQVGEHAAREFVRGRPKTEIRFFPFHEYRKLMPFIYSHLFVSSFILRERCDVFHSPSGHLPYTYPAPAVITIHDLAIFKHPEWFPESVLARFSSQKILLPRAVKLARRIIVPSEATARDLHELFRIPREQIRVIPHGVPSHEVVAFGGGFVSRNDEMTAEEVRTAHRLASRYLLFVGTIEPRKNVAALIRAFRKLPDDAACRDVTLALVGARGWKFDDVFREIAITNKAYAPHEPVRYLGYVSAGDKFMLMKHAAAFVFPSFYEGFGLPVLEAMSMGTPVITSNAGALPEVVGEAALLVNPRHETELTGAMARALRDKGLWHRLSADGRKRASEFSWVTTARRTLEVYQEVVRH
ncbi:glycosyltransferase family 4 protein [Candidatus Uhrbacteria bacterium]|nr:glycosyltransferase family 4 protein [Candidatus Uhrbacteria bacterium]